MSKRPAYTVSAPDVEASYDDPGPALSRTLTEALKARRPITVYARNPHGDAIGYSERDEDGNVITVQHKATR